MADLTQVKPANKPVFAIWVDVLRGVTTAWKEIIALKAYIRELENRLSQREGHAEDLAVSVRKYALTLHDSKKPAESIQVELLKLLNTKHFTKDAE